MHIYAKLEGQNSDGVAQGSRREGDGRGGGSLRWLEPGRELLEPTSGNTGISLAMVAKLKGYPLDLRPAGERNAERVKLLELYGAKLVCSRPRTKARTAP